MPVSCKPLGQVRFNDVFDGRLQKFGVYERLVEGKSIDRHRSLTDGRNSLWVDANLDGEVSEITVFGTNDVRYIKKAIFETCGVKIVTEYQPEYWGFKTLREWEIARSIEHHQAFYLELLKYFNGQPNQIEADHFSGKQDEIPPIIAMVKARIARRLLTQDSSLANPEKKVELLRRTLTEFDDLRSAIRSHADYVGMLEYEHTKMLQRCQAEEDKEESACLYIFQTDQRGVIVAVELPGSREAIAERHRRGGDLDNEIPF